MTEKQNALTYEALTGADVRSVLNDVARLRISVFRDFPYLYDGSLDYERDYLARFAASDGAVVVVASDGGKVVGAATGCPLSVEHDEFKAPFSPAGWTSAAFSTAPNPCCCRTTAVKVRGVISSTCARSRAATWGRAIAPSARSCGPTDHPARPANYTPLDPFWSKRGYRTGGRPDHRIFLARSSAMTMIR